MTDVARVVNDYAAGHQNEWAGMWLENEVLFVAFTGRLDEHRAALIAATGDESIRVVSARWPKKELEALAEEIVAAFPKPVSVTSAGFDAKSNTVRVGVLPVALERAAEVATRWAPRVTVVHERKARTPEPR